MVNWQLPFILTIMQKCIFMIFGQKMMADGRDGT